MLKLFLVFLFLIIKPGLSSTFIWSADIGIGMAGRPHMQKSHFGLNRHTDFGFNVNVESQTRLTPLISTGVMTGWNNFSAINETAVTTVHNIYKLLWQSQGLIPLAANVSWIFDLGLGPSLLHVSQVDRDMQRISGSHAGMIFRPGTGLVYKHLFIKIHINYNWYGNNRDFSWQEWTIGREF